MPNLRVKDPAERLELAYLYPDGDTQELKNLIAVAKEIAPGVSCRAVVVHAGDLQYVVPLLKGTTVRPVVVIDFPDGLGGLRAKKDQARLASQCGVTEADVVVNLRQVSARDKQAIIRECLTVREYIPNIKLIAQIPYLWTVNPHAVFWLIDFLPKAGVYCLKDWTGKRNFSPSAKVDFSTLMRLHYMVFLVNYMRLYTPLLRLKIAGEVNAENARAFVDAEADFLGVSYDKAKAVREALLRDHKLLG